MKIYKFEYFDNTDFMQAVPSCKISDMQWWFIDKLDDARRIANVPFVINSAYRSLYWEKKRGRSGYSSHTKGIAVDIKCRDGFERIKIMKGLMAVGFTRIGIYDGFIHIDADDSKNNSLWLG